MRKLLWLPIAIGFLVAWGLVLSRLVQGNSSQTNLEWFGHLTSVLGLAILTVTLVVLGLSLKGLVVGHDSRVSTSKVQPLMWTYALASALLSLAISNWAGAEKGYDALLKEGLKDEYLLLLGGPFAAAVAARGILTAKLQSGDIAKTEGTPQLTQVVTDDAGNTDLVDTQYLLLNLVALVFFVGAFVTQANDGLPEIPDVLVGLTGVAAATYVSNKAVLKEVPVLLRIVPPIANVGQLVTVYGRALRISTLSPEGELELQPAQVTFDDSVATVTRTLPAPTGVDRLDVTVPDVPGRSGPTAINVRATNAAGVESNTLAFTIQA